MKISTRPAPRPLAGDTWTADVSADTAVHNVAQPEGAAFTSTKYTADPVGSTLDAKNGANDAPTGTGNVPKPGVDMVTENVQGALGSGAAGFEPHPAISSDSDNTSVTAPRVIDPSCEARRDAYRPRIRSGS